MVRKTKLDRDMAEEMRAHLEEQTHRNVAAGMSPDEARAAARRQFGGVAQIQERARETRGWLWLTQVGQDLRYAVRSFARAPGFTATAVLTLALGIGMNTAMFSVVSGVLLRPLPYPEPARLVTLWESNPALGAGQQKASWLALDAWRTQDRVLAEVAYWTGPEAFNLVTDERVEKVRAAYVSSAMFSVLRINPTFGRGFVPEEDAAQGPQVAVISHEAWQNRFGGDPAVLGRTLTVDTFGRRVYTIVGVMPAGFAFPDQTELWLPAGWNGLPRDRLTPHWLNVIARLADGVSIAQAQRTLNVAQARIATVHPDGRAGTEVLVVPLLEHIVGGRTRTALLVLWAVTAGVLLIACVNVANLLLARAASRRQETAVRVALGAGRMRIVRQFLTESVLLSLLGGAAGVLLASWGVKLLVALGVHNTARLSNVTVDGASLAFTVAAAVLTGIVFGLVPAWHCARPDLSEALKATGGSSSAAPGAGHTRSALVVSEVSLATVLLVIAGLMLQSFVRLITADRGFRAEQVITAELDFSVAGFTTWVEETDTRPQISVQQLMERLRALPGVQAVGGAYGFPALRRDNLPPGGTFTIFGRTSGEGAALPTAYEKAISPGYLEALELTLLRGRDIADTDTLKAPSVVLINETFARRYFPGEDPLGQHLAPGRADGPVDATDSRGLPTWSRIVGVVADMKSLAPQPEPTPEVFRSYWQWPMQSPMLFARTLGDPATLAGVIRRETAAMIPNVPAPVIQLMVDRVEESIAQPRFQTVLLNLFSLVGLLLAAFGLYGVLAYVVTQRRREIGIRMALGAKPSHVLLLVVTQGMRLVLGGIVIGLVAAVAVTRFVRSQLYEVQAMDWATYGAAAIVLLLVALLACWLPARRAARVDPVIALRTG